MSKADNFRVRGYLEHILKAIQRIHYYVENMTETGFLEDIRTQDAVIRNFVRIPRDFDHRFHGKTITDSSAFRSLIPRQSDR